MSEKTEQVTSVTSDKTTSEALETVIRGRVVMMALAGGLAGIVLMLPIIVGIPRLFGLFSTEPITEFAGIAASFGIEPTLGLGIGLFIFGGTVALPLSFLVTGSFLPPEKPRFVRGATFAMFFWVGFVPAFWPDGDALTVAVFLVVSLVGHWVYGLTLGFILDRTTGIPQHEV